MTRSLAPVTEEWLPALFWMARTANPYPFASNRFSRSEAAYHIHFVSQYPRAALYIATTQEEEEGPYADALYVSYANVADTERDIIHGYILRHMNPDDYGYRFADAPRVCWYWWD